MEISYHRHPTLISMHGRLPAVKRGHCRPCDFPTYQTVFVLNRISDWSVFADVIICAWESVEWFLRKFRLKKNHPFRAMAESDIQQFYKSLNIFVTGGTGFMGKILLEKLLRSTEVSTIYVLVREKKGANVHARLDELFEDAVFERLKRECPKYKHRVEGIPGDCSVPGLGLSITDRQKLIADIQVVFHGAATVRFDENLKLSYDINVNGTKEVLELCREMTNLKSLMHVSTAYSNCHLDEIEEKFYDSPFGRVRNVLENITKEDADILTSRIISPWPNTYTYTKALAESLIKQMAGRMPVGIYRPAIVISTSREPIEGWIDNLYGPTGTCVGAIMGIVRVVPCDPTHTAELVPVDTCVAGLIAAAWDVANRDTERRAENIPIYNYVSSVENPLTWTEFSELNLLYGKKYPPVNSLWTTTLLCISNSSVYSFLKLILHIIPALLLDVGLVLTGNKPRMLRMYRKVHKFSEILSYFSHRSWSFSNKNTANLWLKMNKTDRDLFPLSMTTVHWLLYFRRYIKGMRVHLLKDPESTLVAARKRQSRFAMVEMLLKIALTFSACNLVSSVFSSALNLIV